MNEFEPLKILKSSNLHYRNLLVFVFELKFQKCKGAILKSILEEIAYLQYGNAVLCI